MMVLDTSLPVSKPAQHSRSQRVPTKLPHGMAAGLIEGPSKKAEARVFITVAAPGKADYQMFCHAELGGIEIKLVTIAARLHSHWPQVLKSAQSADQPLSTSQALANLMLADIQTRDDCLPTLVKFFWMEGCQLAERHGRERYC
jgi:hypothetical protein